MPAIASRHAAASRRTGIERVLMSLLGGGGAYDDTCGYARRRTGPGRASYGGVRIRDSRFSPDDSERDPGAVSGCEPENRERRSAPHDAA
jgi:hypothetical protein